MALPDVPWRGAETAVWLGVQILPIRGVTSVPVRGPQEDREGKEVQ